MKKITLLLTGIILFSAFPLSDVQAKVLPRYQSSGKAPAKVAAPSGVAVSPRLRGDRRALEISFSNLSKANNVSYVLTYQTNGMDQGAQGSVSSSSGNSTSREVLFGTCSSGVCTYHANITNMKLEVTVELANGKKTVKRYKIKI
jgi:hypothetical protein